MQPAQITTDRKDLPVEEGDLFERRLPSGVVERYTVLDAGYHQGLDDGEGFCLAKVRKQTKSEPTKPPAQVVYNISGTNARVNIQSVDTSMNLVAVEPTELFKKIRETISSAVPESRARELLGRVDAMEAAQGTPDFMARYREFITLPADHLTVLAPFLPALTLARGQRWRTGARSAQLARSPATPRPLPWRGAGGPSGPAVHVSYQHLTRVGRRSTPTT